MQRASLAALILVGGTTIPLGAIQNAAAQEIPTVDPEEARSVMTASVSQSLETDSNYDLDQDPGGSTTLAITRFAFALDQNSSTQALSLGFDTGITGLWQPDESFEVQAASPSTAFLSFINEGPNTTFDADLRIRSREVDFNNPLDDFVSDGGLPDNLDDLEGNTREYRFDADVGLALGTNSPSTYGVRFIGSNIDYNQGTDDPDLEPRRTVEGQAFWTLRVTPVVSTVVTGDYLYYSADNPGETELRVAQGDAGFIYEPSDVLRMSVGVGYADRERKDLVDGEREVTQSDQGPVVRGDFRYTLPELVVTGNARWTTAAPSARTSFNLNGNYILPRGRLIGRLFNRYTGSDRGSDELRVTGGGIGIVHDLNTVSRVRLDLSYAYQENLDDSSDPDITRTDVTAAFAYDLTETVSAELGYRYRTKEDGPVDADSHRFSVTLAKAFETGY